MVHKSGYIFGDLKLDNILVGENDSLPHGTENVFEDISLNLIDFGFARRYMDKDGKHLEEAHSDLF